MYMSKKPPSRKKSRKRKREKGRDRLYRKLDLSFPSSVAASSLTASAGLPNSDMIANASTNRLKLFYGPDIGDYVPPGRSTSAASSSLSELDAIQRDQYPEYLDSKKDPKRYVTQMDTNTLLFGGRKTRRKKCRRKTKKKRKTRRKKRRRKRKTKKRRK